jgi:hypothetical protein
MASQCNIRRPRRHLALMLTALTLSLSAFSRIQGGEATRAVAPQAVELSGGGTKALNYTPWYIHTFSITGPAGSGIRGGGPNVMPTHEDGRPGAVPRPAAPPIHSNGSLI